MAAAKSAPEPASRSQEHSRAGVQRTGGRATAHGSAAERIGVLGGTFDPPHVAHLALARMALAELDLQRVLVMPARMAPHKGAHEDAGRQHRLRMCQLTFAGQPRLEVSTLELDRPGPSYTLDTLRSIRATNPDARLVLLAGADTAQSLPAWHEPREILRLAELAVAGREGRAREAVQSAVRSVDEHARLTFLAMAETGLSSSQVRARVAACRPIHELVGAEVARYIAEHRLYRG